MKWRNNILSNYQTRISLRNHTTFKYNLRKQEKKKNLCEIDSTHHSAGSGPLIGISSISGHKISIMSWIYCHISNIKPVPRRYWQTVSLYSTGFRSIPLVYNSCSEASLVNSLTLGKVHAVYLNKRVSLVSKLPLLSPSCFLPPLHSSPPPKKRSLGRRWVFNTMW